MTAVPHHNSSGFSWLPGFRLVLWLVLIWACPGGILIGAESYDLSKLPPASAAPVDFVREVQPLLAKHCVRCHGVEKQKGGLRLDGKQAALRGSDAGVVLVPGKSAESRLIHLVAGLDPDKPMPPKGDRLTPRDVGLLRAWIDQGAAWPEQLGASAGRSRHWSLQPLKFPPLPANPGGLSRALNPIDAFIVARLDKSGLVPSPEADRAALIRRLSIDLIGLPPTPQEVDRFVPDAAPEAYEQLVDRLLNSPRYGERWGRHWLDVARYTESNGFEYDALRDNAWHYRDYVIRSFNEDKPYDRFMQEQLAGDVWEPVTRDGMIASSLLVCGPWDAAGNAQANATQKAITREDELEDLISVVGQTFLGLTVNCARCHSHKFDPIPHEDYYRIKSVFEGVKHGERTVAAAFEVQSRSNQLARLKSEIAEAEAAVARDHPQALVARLEQLRKELADLPPLPLSYAGTRVQPAPTRRLKRGDVKSPEEVVTPGALSAIADLPNDLGLAADAPEGQRRLRFAHWLADVHNPLPARVMVNRIWHFHFGQGLVTTPNDFGASGVPPSHPELLDWLASAFVERGWSVKAIHRLIVTSATYRQSSRFEAKPALVDQDNQLLWRFPPRRLEGEILRDSILAISGQINLQEGGPSFRPFEVLKFPANAYVPTDKLGPEYNRRTVYRMNVNSGKEPLMDAFDCPDPAVKTPRRGVTTTPLQALGLMNNAFVQRQTVHFAERVSAEAHGDMARAVETAYRYALGRSATAAELERGAAAVWERGLPHLCWALLNSTEFVYVR